MDQDKTPDLNDRFQAAYWQILRELDAQRMGQWERSQLTFPQLRVLFQVRRSPGITTGQLARSLGVTMSTTSGLVGKLADRGLVVRGSSEDDRRQMPLSLSEAGRVLAGELADYVKPFLDGVADELGSELRRVVEVLESVAAAASRVRTS